MNAPSDSTPARPQGQIAPLRALRALGSVTVVLWALLAALWLLTVTGRGIPTALNRSVALAALAAALAWGLLACGRTLRAGSGAGGRLLLVLIGLSLAVRFIGLDFELAERFYADEGYYTRHATDINGGRLLVATFNYPHLLYYLDAFAIWVASLFAETALAISKALYGVADWPLFCRLVARAVAATLGALTVVPVFKIGERLAGALGGTLAAAFILFSTLYNDGSHLAICDVPSAFFAAVALFFVARLLEVERLRDYLLAGLAAGLAAGAKYPAGVVAVAIVAVWIRWRLGSRGSSAGRRPLAATLGEKLGPVWAGLVAIAAFVVTTPALVLLPEAALEGQRGVLFGLRVHGGTGWIGVTPPSNSLYYLGLLAGSFGLVALAAAPFGVVFLEREARRRLAWLMVFPAVYLALIVAMSVAVERNLYPALPILAVLAGVCAAGFCGRVAGALPRRSERGEGAVKAEPGLRGRAMAVGIALVLLAWPVTATALQTVGLTRPGTRVVAAEWMRENLPRGAILLKEAFTPEFSDRQFAVRQPRDRFVGATPMEEIRRPEIDFVVLSSYAWARFFEPQREVGPAYFEARARYEEIFDTFTRVERWSPGPARLGPEVSLWRVRRDPGDFGDRARYPAGHAFVPEVPMLDQESWTIRFAREGQWCLFRGLFRGGRYRLAVEGEVVTGRLVVRDLGGGEIAAAEFDPEGVATFDLPGDDKFHFYLELAPGSAVTAVEIAPG